MKRRQAACDGANVLALPGPGRDQPRKRVGLGEAAHLHGVLDRAAGMLARELEAGSCPDDRANAQVEIRGELAVDAHLLAAGRVPARERAVVQEREGEGLLDLVRPPAGDEHPRGVRLVSVDRRAAAVDRRVHESLQQEGVDVSHPAWLAWIDLCRGRAHQRDVSCVDDDLPSMLTRPPSPGIRETPQPGWGGADKSAGRHG